MAPAGPRVTTLELARDDLRALLSGAATLAEREILATAQGPVFSEPPNAERLNQLFGAQEDLPAEGGSVSELLADCGEVLAAGRRTAPAFFGYVHSPPSPLGVAADLIASAA